jgi:hypothetical protein
MGCTTVKVVQSGWCIKTVKMKIVHNVQIQQICNPLGLHRSVEKTNTAFSLHPVRDASLQDAGARGAMAVSTERCIPYGMRGGEI